MTELHYLLGCQQDRFMTSDVAHLKVVCLTRSVISVSDGHVAVLCAWSVAETVVTYLWLWGLAIVYAGCWEHPGVLLLTAWRLAYLVKRSPRGLMVNHESRRALIVYNVVPRSWKSLILDYRHVPKLSLPRHEHFDPEKSNQCLHSIIAIRPCHSTGRFRPHHLKGRSFGRLSQSSVLIRAHFHTDTLQDLFDPHIAVPVSHGWQFLRLDGPCSRIDTAHVDFGNKADLRRDGGIFVGTVNSQLVKSAIVVGLSRQWLRQQNWKMITQNAWDHHGTVKMFASVIH